MRVSFRDLNYFDKQQREDIFKSMHLKSVYKKRGLHLLTDFVGVYQQSFHIKATDVKLLVYLLNSRAVKYYKDAIALISVCFKRLSEIDYDEYELLMRLLVLIGSYGSLTLWQVVNWVQFNYSGGDVFDKFDKRMLYERLVILCEFGLLKQADFSYIPKYVHGVINDKKTLIVNHNVKTYHAYFLTNFGLRMVKQYINDFIATFQNREHIDINTKLFTLKRIDYLNNTLWKKQILNCWVMFNWQYQLQASGLANLLIIPSLAVNLLCSDAVSYRFGWRSNNTFYTVNAIFSDNYSYYIQHQKLNFISLPIFKQIYGTDLFMNQRKNEQKKLVSYEIPTKRLILVPNYDGSFSFLKADYDYLITNDNTMLFGNYYLIDSWKASYFRDLTDNSSFSKISNNNHLFMHSKNADVVTNYQKKIQLINHCLYDMSDLL